MGKLPAPPRPHVMLVAQPVGFGPPSTLAKVRPWRQCVNNPAPEPAGIVRVAQTTGAWGLLASLRNALARLLRHGIDFKRIWGLRMASQTRTAGTVLRDHEGDGVWRDLSNALADDDIYALLPNEGWVASTRLLFTDFAFDLPAGATITGYEFGIKCAGINGQTRVNPEGVRLFDHLERENVPSFEGVGQGSMVLLPTEMGVLIFGGQANTWGTPDGWPTVDHWNGLAGRVGVSFRVRDTSETGEVRVDAAWLTIHYEVG